jgi:hypothetical protein
MRVLEGGRLLQELTVVLVADLKPTGQGSPKQTLASRINAQIDRQMLHWVEKIVISNV